MTSMETPRLTPLKRKKPRKLTRFLAQELLYEFEKGQLDPERKQALEEYLPTCTETQQELEYLRRGLELCREYRKLSVNPQLVGNFMKLQTSTEKALSWLSPMNWPEYLRWGAEALVVSMVVGATVTYVPWQKISKFVPKRSTDITIVEVQKEKITPAPAPQPAAPAAPPSIPDQAQAPEPPVQAAADPAPATPPPAAVVTVKAKPAPAPAPAKVAVEKNEAVDEAVAPSAPVGSEKGPGRGTLYRAFMSFEDTELVNGQIREVITQLNGIKAGQVELGWSKPGGKYFHFTLPEENFESFKTRLEAIGPVRISKEPHPRVMPEGKIRIILWVEDSNLQQ